MPEVTIELFTSCRCIGKIKEASYRYVMTCAGAKIEGTGEMKDTTGNRLAMTALIAALKRMRKPSVITVFTSNGYLIQGWKKAVGWEKEGWVRENGQTIKNSDLWQEILRLQKGHAVRYLPSEESDTVKTAQT